MKQNGAWPPATKPFLTNPPEGTAGIVLPIRDNLKFFKLAFHSILDFTDYRYMLTLVDNMSGFSTRQYLESIRRNHPVNVLQYQQTHAQGAEWNLGLRFMFAFANVQYGVVLSPDIVVEPYWLSRLTNTLAKTEDIVSPTSNDPLAGLGAPLPFCTAFKRLAYERLNGFDERFHGSLAVMLDFGERARKAGFRPVFDAQIYVHHFKQLRWRSDPDLEIEDENLLNAQPST